MIVDPMKDELPLDMCSTDDDVEPASLDWSQVRELEATLLQYD